MDLRHVSTPAAIVDLDRLERNIARSSRRAQQLRVDLRPHVKTHKCNEIAALQAAAGCAGFTVSTLGEALCLAEAGHNDLTYAVPIAPNKLEAAVGMVASGIDLKVLIDHHDTVDAAEEVAASIGQRLPVLIKVDCGYHRAGVDPKSGMAVSLARRICNSHGLDFRGILTHAGHSYTCKTRADALEVARLERDVTVRFANRLRDEGLQVPVVSVGSTPTFAAVDHLEGVTEARPGNSVFFDFFQSAIGAAQVDDIAFAVLATVIGVYPERGNAVIDAGALALSRDPGPSHLDPWCGFGLVRNLDRTPNAELRLASISQEHGLLKGPELAIASLRTGQPLLILPNHSCLSAACFDRYHTVRDGRIVGTWRTWGPLR